MAMPPIDFKQEVLATVSNVSDLPQESSSPWEHYRRSANDAWNLVVYMDRNVARVNHYSRPFERHMSRLHGMALANLVGAFERFLKELAVVCVNELSDFPLDGRLDDFSLKGSVAAAHFDAQTLGSALCEADTWLNQEIINKRFRKMLADPFKVGDFFVFPMSNQQGGTTDDVVRSQLIPAVFQLRHTLVHNLGVVTQSDATKFRQNLKSSIGGGKVLTPSSKNVRQIKRMLDESAKSINQRMADRLAALLCTLSDENHLSIDPAAKAQALASIFRVPVVICGHTASP